MRNYELDLNEKLRKLSCGVLIIAGGGYSRVYSVSSSRDFENYGEGIALAYEAEADFLVGPEDSGRKTFKIQTQIQM
jgi:aspartate oxidase